MANTSQPSRPHCSSSSSATAIPRAAAPELATSNTEHDVESQSPFKVSHLRLLIDQACITPEVLAAKYPGDGTTESPFIVDFLPKDPRDPMTFPGTKKWTISLVQAGATLAVSFASSAYSGGASEILAEFQASQNVVILGVSLFVLGFAIGPLFWAPLSELYGRQKLFFGTYFALTAFNAGAAGAPNMAALIILRFFAGAFGSSALTNAGGVIADMFHANERGIATSIFAMAPFLGPALGPIAGGFLGEAAGWRWVEGLVAAFTGVFWILSTVVYPETYTPVLLRARAAALSKQTGKVYASKLDAGQPQKSFGARLKMALSRPFVLLFREPIVFLTSIYMAIIYGTLYMCFAAFPIVFEQARGWSPGIEGLAFIGIAVGMTISTVGTIFDNKRYARAAASSPGGMAPPEARLPPAIVGSVLIPVGLFWFAWTNGTNIHWAVPIVGTGFFASGIVLVFLSLMNYLIDSYLLYAASALAANAVLRSLFGMAFPLFTTYMYKDLGIHWASSVPAFLSLACLPFPFLFYKYGEKLRLRCKYAAEAAVVFKMLSGKQQQQQQPPPAVEEEAASEVEEAEKDGSRHSDRDTT